MPNSIVSNFMLFSLISAASVKGKPSAVIEIDNAESVTLLQTMCEIFIWFNNSFCLSEVLIN